MGRARGFGGGLGEGEMQAAAGRGARAAAWLCRAPLLVGAAIVLLGPLLLLWRPAPGPDLCALIASEDAGGGGGSAPAAEDCVPVAAAGAGGRGGFVSVCLPPRLGPPSGRGCSFSGPSPSPPRGRRPCPLGASRTQS